MPRVRGGQPVGTVPVARRPPALSLCPAAIAAGIPGERHRPGHGPGPAARERQVGRNAGDGQGAIPGAAVIASVKWYDPVRGFGFLAPVDGSRDVFCHSSAVAHAGWLTLPEGATVTCEVVEGRQGRQVSRIHEIDASSATPERAGSGRPLHGERGPAPAEPVPPHGRRRVVASVKWFVATRGYGFLSPADGSSDVFCHASVVADAATRRCRRGRA